MTCLCYTEKNGTTSIMEEIICQACGRPNLPGAKKCWYCQEALEKPGEGGAGQAAPDEAGSLQPDAWNLKAEQPPVHPAQPEEITSEIPEWLQRIRELKKAEQPPEDDQDRWQQQRLFTLGAAPDEDAPAESRPKRSSHPAPRPRRPEEPGPKPAPAASLPLEPVRESADEAAAQTNPEGDLSDDLPDGFTPITDIDSK